MQDLSTQYALALAEGYELQGTHIVIGEWSFNDIVNTTVVNETDPNATAWVYQKDYFPPQSVTSGFRPDAGIHYAIANESIARRAGSQLYSNRFYTSSPVSIDPTPIAPGDDISNTSNSTGFSPNVHKYQYWMSPFISAGSEDSLNAGSYAIDSCQLTVNYVADPPSTIDDTQPVPSLSSVYVKTNKIKIGFNYDWDEFRTGSLPVDWTIEVKYLGDSGYTVIATNPLINLDPLQPGACLLWWNGSSWTTTQSTDIDTFKQICSIRIVVTSVDSKLRRLAINEISLRREIDLTSRVLNWNINLDTANQDYIHPAGTMSASDGTINLHNYDQAITETDITSSLYGLLAGWSQYRIYINYDLTKWGGTNDIVQMGTMYTNDYQQQNDFEYQIVLFDLIKRLQVTTCPTILIQNQKIGQILSTILDLVGIDKYRFSSNAFNAGAIVDYFWSDGTLSIFDQLDKLCQSQQASIFVDEFGYVCLLTRDDIASNSTTVPVWTFNGLTTSGHLADIISLNKKYTLQANDVLIQYNEMIVKNADATTSLTQSNVDSEDITQTPLTTQLFQTSDTVVLRASPVTKNILKSTDVVISPNTTSNKDIWINSTDAVIWPFAGKVLIGGEYIQYIAKGYTQWLYNATIKVWTSQEKHVQSLDEQQQLDQATYNSFKQTVGSDTVDIGGISINPAQQNGFTGRLVVGHRNIKGTGEGVHSPNPADGWFGIDGWEATKPAGKSTYFEYGHANTLANVQDWRNKPNWAAAQTKWTWKNSILSCNNIKEAGYSDTNRKYLWATYLRQLDSNKYSEFGTRFRFSNGNGGIGLAIYLSNAVGYDPDTADITDPTLATRGYFIGVTSSSLAHGVNPNATEVGCQVKNHDSITNMIPSKAINSTGGHFQIELNTWYDLDVVVEEIKDATDATDVSSVRILVFINGTFIDSWTTTDAIKPTPWCGLVTKGAVVADYEYFYAVSTQQDDASDDSFTAEVVQLPSGTNIVKSINIPTDEGACGRAVISFATTGSSATINSLKIIVNPDTAYSTIVKKNTSAPSNLNNATIGPLTIGSDSRVWFYLDEIIYRGNTLKVNYTSTNELSMCVEYSQKGNIEYGVFDNNIADNNRYDPLNNSFASNKLQDLLMGIPAFQQYLDVTSDPFISYFDDFGDIAHEVRDFDFYLDTSPAISTSIFSSNANVRIIDEQYNPMKAIFTMVNASHENEIVNGTQQIDDSNSIDQSIIIYGYALVNNGSKTKEVKDSTSIRKRGAVTATISADWVFNDREADNLATWIVTHWSNPMDVLEIEVFSNSHIQLGDKVKINYPNGDVGSNWIFLVIKTSRTFDENGFSSVLTLQRVA